MKKSEKSTIVEQLAAQFGRATMTLVSEYRGLTAAESTDLRRRIREVEGEVKVAKNTLVRLAIKETPYAGLDQQLGGPVIIIFCYGDALTLAKAVLAIRELGDKFKLRGGILGGQPLSNEELRAFATLPPREVIIAQLLGLLQAPATRLVRLLNEPGSSLARLIDAIGRQRGGTEVEPVDNVAPAQEAGA